MKIHTIILIAVAVGLVGCSHGQSQVSVANHSGVTISNVWVSGPRFAQSLGNLPPATEVHLVVEPRGESRCWLSYEAANQKIDSGGRDYFEVSLSHPVSVTIGAELKFTTSDGVKHF